MAALGAVAAVVAAASFLAGAPMVSAANETPSDPARADFFQGNVVNCGDIGLPDDTLAFANGADPIDDGNVSGVVVANTSSIHTGEGQMVNVDDPKNGAVIDAVVVKGGNAYNQYDTSSGTPPANHVPPVEDTPTRYIAPFNGGGNVPAVSHWFICYHDGETPEVGSLLVSKDLVTNGRNDVPATFSIRVVCSGGLDVTFPLAGGESHVISPISAGATCTVSEDQTGFVQPFTVTIDQPAAIPAGGQSTATVHNTFTVVPITVSPETVTAAQPVAASPVLTG